MPLLQESLTIRFLFVFLFSVILIKCYKPVAIKIGLIDQPDKRKHHIGAVPLVGGIVVYTAVLITSLMAGDSSIQLYCYLASAGALVITGALDDRYDISANWRLGIEFVAALIMIFGAGVYINSLGNLFGMGEIHLPMLIAVPFTLLAVAAYINAMNMSDGIDGMAASLSIMTLFTMTIMMHGHLRMAVPAITIAAALLGFLLFNLQVVRKLRKVFLGDAGSMFLGFTFAWMVIRLAQDTGEGSVIQPITALYILGIPLVDMLSTIARRVKKGQSPFKPDRTHVHHILLHAGFTPRQTLGIILLVGGMFHGIGIALHYAGVRDVIQLIIFLVIFTIYYQAVIHAFRLSKLIQHFKGKRKPAKRGRFYTRFGKSKRKMAENGAADHLTHQP